MRIRITVRILELRSTSAAFGKVLTDPIAMFDIQLRSRKDRIFLPLCDFVPRSISPIHITLLGFYCGLGSCYAASQGHVLGSLILWVLNRALDCLDGAVARQRNIASQLGGFLDLLADFIVYSLIPIGIAIGKQGGSDSLTWFAVAILEASFHINNFVLFYIAAVIEGADKEAKATKELTSLAMMPALIEGFESGLLFTAMLLLPQYILLWSWIMALLVAIGICQRVISVAPALGQLRPKNAE